MNLEAVNATAFALHPNTDKLNKTIASNSAWLANHKTDETQAHFLLRIALSDATDAYCEQIDYAPFASANFDHVYKLAQTAFEHVDLIETGEPALMWDNPWAINAHSAVEYALIISFFSHETGERLVDLSALSEEQFAMLRECVEAAHVLDPDLIDTGYLLQLTGADTYWEYENDHASLRNDDLFAARLATLTPCPVPA